MKNAITLSAPLTLVDWILRPPMEPYENPEEAVRYVLTRCKEFGLSRVHWRTICGSRAMYKSQLVPPVYYEPPREDVPGIVKTPQAQGDRLKRLQRIDCREFDSLECAVRIGHELGLEIYAWISINEEQHGTHAPGSLSRGFSQENPHYRWVRRSGYRYTSQVSFAFPEVREYKLGIIKEHLAYDIDGLFIDWIRTGNNADNPQTDAEGYADYGYETPNLEAFQKLYHCDARYVPNCDARWVDVRCRPQTQFMREVRKISGEKKIITLVQHAYSLRGVLPEVCNDENEQAWVRALKGNTYAGAKEGLLCDISTWAAEGLMDAVMVAGYYTPGNTPEMALDYLHEMVGDHVEMQVYSWLPRNVNDPGLNADLQLARSRGIGEVLLWEADYMDAPNEEIRKAIMEEIREKIKQIG